MKKSLLLLLMAFAMISVHAQDLVLTGKITDSSGSPLQGATVYIKSTNISATTDGRGNFQIHAGARSNPTLVVSYVGYQTQEIATTDGTFLSIALHPDASSLNDVVVVGYGTQRKSDITGASSSVKAAEIAKRPLVRLEQALQGTTAGVNVISPNGQPGQGLKVKIRGANSITGSTEPLYVIDGNIGSGSDVNVNDVASIEILKDAASTAIYGSRGSNGVVLITTKQGSTGKARVGFSGWWRKDKIPRELDLMGPYDFARSVNAQFVSQGSTPAFTDAQLDDFKTGKVKGTDWQRALHTSPLVQNYQVDLSGGTDAVKYYFSLGYLNQPGIILNQWYHRTSFRANVDVKMNDRMDMKFFVVSTIPQSHNNGYGGGLGDPFNQAVEWDPTSLIRDPVTGAYINHSQYASIQFNPVAQAESQAHDNISTNIAATAVYNYRILRDLTFTSSNTYSIGNGFEQDVDGPGTSAYDSKNDNATVKSNRSRGFLTSNFLTYKHTFGDHAITATALYEYNTGQNTSVTAASKNLTTYSLGYYNLGLGASQSTSSGYSADALISYLGRIYYTYKDKYTVSASIRTDGSSHLTQKWSTFPSLGASWNLKKERFLEGSSLFDDLRLRASYGQTGNQAVAAYSTIPVLNVGQAPNSNQINYYYNGGNSTPSVAVTLGTPVSTSLNWEKKATYDAGIDAAFLKGRLTLVIDAYSSKVTSLLYNIPAPQYLGGGNYNTNIGSLSNKGIEIALGGTPISKSKFRWNTNFNISFNKNKVLNLGGLDNVLSIGGNNTFNSIIKVGQPLGEFIGLQYLGTWRSKDAAEAAQYGMKPGDARYQDVDGDHLYNTNDWLPLGNATPKFSYGFINDISYGAFTFSFMIQGQQGSQVFSQTLAYLWGGLGDMKNATTMEAVPENLWTASHETDNPAWSNSSHSYNNSSRYVYNSSYAKLKNISLTYDVPVRGWANGRINNLQVYVSGQNLWTITSYKGYDPEIDQQPTGNAISQGQEFGVIPNPKSATIGLRVGL